MDPPVDPTEGKSGVQGVDGDAAAIPALMLMPPFVAGGGKR